MCHFELAASALGLEGVREIKAPRLSREVIIYNLLADLFILHQPGGLHKR